MISKFSFAPRALLALLAAAPAAALAHNGSKWNLPPGVTEVSHDIYGLHMLIFWICVAIGVLVFGAMLFSIIFHRKSRGYEPATFHESTKLEIAWTVVPMLILIGMAIPATEVLVKIYDSGGEDMTIEVRGYQWKWQYKYLDDDLKTQVSFFSRLATPRDEIDGKQAKTDNYLLEVDHPLVIPTHTKVRLLLTSNDVIHAWWVPDFGLKRDAIPGFINDVWTIVDEPGTYRGQCAELCGKDHGFMPIVVKALPMDEYKAWYADQVKQQMAKADMEKKDWTADALYAKGKEVYDAHCVACHQANGKGIPPVYPAIAGSSIATGDLEKHMDVVYNGRAGTAMQGFGTELDPAEIAAVIQYQRHAFGNDTGDVVTPAQVLAFAQTN